MCAQSSRFVHHFVNPVIGVLTIALSVPVVHAQITSGGPIFDRGPRNPGTVAADNNCPLNHPGVDDGPTKFAVPGNNCIDIDQPPAPAGNPPADGAGNLIGETTNPANAFNFATQPLSIMWFQALSIFETVASVQGAARIPTKPRVGLGPSFNPNSCPSCHSAPAVGGSSPGSVSIVTKSGGSPVIFNMPLEPPFSGNPELAAATDQGGTSINPTFPSGSSVSGVGFTDVPVNGPVIEVRFVNGLAASGNAAGVQPGGGGELFTFQGRSDAPAGCSISQLNFGGVGSKSLGFRIPTPTYGLGLVENTPELTLLNNLASNPSNPNAAAAAALGITGSFNRSGNDGTITRFGWKAQNKSLLIFAGEASNVEMGVSNELFPNEKTLAAGATCPTNTAPAGNQPEDEILPATFAAGTGAANIASIISSNAENNAVFMRMNGAPSQCDAVTLLTTDPYGTTGPAQCPPFTTAPVTNGQTLFNNAKLGCAQCHSPTLVSGLSQNSSLSNQTYHPYSDFALHNMGANLSDGVTQGGAGPAFFRTAPLWGVGQRIFFLHDGRASDLVTAIEQQCPSPAATGGGEACGSINAFNNLTQAQQQAILDFLRSL